MAQATAKPDERVLVLQGGGALGAYQAGMFEAPTQAQLEPDWIETIAHGGGSAITNPLRLPDSIEIGCSDRGPGR
jgi:NTE family protein